MSLNARITRNIRRRFLAETLMYIAKLEDQDPSERSWANFQLDRIASIAQSAARSWDSEPRVARFYDKMRERARAALAAKGLSPAERIATQRTIYPDRPAAVCT